MAAAQYVYGIRALPDGPVKIGHAHNVEGRLRALQTGAHERLEIIWSAFGTYHDERKLHVIFAKFRKRGEWFDFGDTETVMIQRYLARGMMMTQILSIDNLSEWLASWPRIE